MNLSYMLISSLLGKYLDNLRCMFTKLVQHSRIMQRHGIKRAVAGPGSIHTREKMEPVFVAIPADAHAEFGAKRSQLHEVGCKACPVCLRERA